MSSYAISTAVTTIFKCNDDDASATPKQSDDVEVNDDDKMTEKRMDCPNDGDNITVDSITQSKYLSWNSHHFACHGTDLAFNGSYEKAIKHLTIAIFLNREDHRLYFNRGYCYLELSRCEDSLLDIELAISLRPDWPKAHFKRGQVLAKMAAFQEAEKAYKTALSLDRDCKETFNQVRGNIYDALRHLGFDVIKSGYASEKYFSIEEAAESLRAGAFEMSLNWTRSVKKSHFKQMYEKKGILIPKNFY